MSYVVNTEMLMCFLLIVHFSLGCLESDNLVELCVVFVRGC